MRILIAGCGDVGTALGLRLVAAGHEVWGLRRNAAALPPALNPISADLAEPATLKVPSGLDAVVYTAAASGFSEEAYRAAYVDGLRNLLAASGGVARVLFTSSTSVYGQSNGEWVDEDSPAGASGFAGRVLREGEELLWSTRAQAIAVRFAGIYGPGRTRLIDTVRSGTATCVEVPPVYTNRIHRDDCAAALQHLLGLERPERLYLGADDEPAPQCEVLRWLARRMGAPEPRVVAASSATEAALRANKRCRNARLKASGYRFLFPSWRDGYAALLGG